jgi:hypothetical protein
MLLLGISQERNPAVPSGTSPASAGGAKKMQNAERRMQNEGNGFAVPSCLKFSLTGVRCRWQKRLLLCLRATFVFAFYIKMRTQKLNLLIPAKTLKALAPTVLARSWGFKGRAP